MGWLLRREGMVLRISALQTMGLVLVGTWVPLQAVGASEALAGGQAAAVSPRRLSWCPLEMLRVAAHSSDVM